MDFIVVVVFLLSDVMEKSCNSEEDICNSEEDISRNVYSKKWKDTLHSLHKVL